MKIRAYSFTALLVPMALGAMTFTGLGADTPTIAQAALRKRMRSGETSS
jgi:hypothetical protein